jgi:hypothetical protein
MVRPISAVFAMTVQGSSPGFDESSSSASFSKVTFSKQKRMRTACRADPSVALSETSEPSAIRRLATAQSSTSIGLTRVVLNAETTAAGPSSQKTRS